MALHIGKPSGGRTGVAVQLPSRQLTSWTPADVDSAITAADGGTLQLAADLTAEIGRDATVRGVRSTRTLGMLGLPLAWSGAEPDDWATLARTPELNRLLEWGLTLGVGLAQILPNGALEAWHPRWLWQDVATRQWRVTTQFGDEAIEPGDGRWIVYTPYGSLEPWVDGLWTALAIPWLIKKFAIHDRARASEVFGSAMIVGTTEGASEPQRVKWLDELKGLSRSSRIILPEGYKLELLEAQGQTWGIYAQAEKWADGSIIITIAGQLTTTQGQSGFSRGDIHETIAHSLIKFGAETFAATLSEQYIEPTWGSSASPQWAIDPPSKNANAAEATKILGDAILSINKALNEDGLRLDAREVVERHGIPVIRQVGQTPQSAIMLAPADIARVVKVDEARASIGLGPLTLADGSADPRGELPISALGEVEEEQESIVAASVNRTRKGLITCSIDALGIPREFQVFAKGRNESDHGVFYFTKRSAEKIMRAIGARDHMVDLEHLSLDSKAPNYDPDARAWLKLELRSGALWAFRVRWTPDGRERLTTRKQRYISPAFRTNKRGEVTSLINIALTALPAMVNLPSLIAATKGTIMSEELLELLGLPSDATMEDALAAIADLQRQIADAAADAGADDTATAAAEAADATDAAAAEAADEEPEEMEEESEHGDDEEEEMTEDVDEEDEKKKKKRAASVTVALAKQVRTLNKRLDKEERLRLMSKAQLSPREKKWLGAQALSVVASYVKALPKRRAASQRANNSGSASAELTAEDLQLCSMTGVTPEAMKAERALEIKKGKVI